MSSTIEVVQHTDWMEISLNRPECLNAFNEAMHKELRAALDIAINPSVRCVLLTGKGRGFCTGQDLSGRDPRILDAPPDLGHTLTTLYNPLIQQIAALQKPVICAVNGVAAGAGANLPLACDIVLAARSARFIQSFAKVGLIPDAGGSWHLPNILGLQRAKAWAMTAEPIDAETAERWGLVWRVYDDEQLMPEARALAQKLAVGPTQGLAACKQIMSTALSHSLSEHLAQEAQVQRQLGMSADYREGVTAFLDKRTPKYDGN